MKLKVQKWGNSAAIKLPAELLETIGVNIGDTVEVNIEAFRIAKPKYSLADLVAQCDLTAPPSADLASWQVMNPIGREIT